LSSEPRTQPTPTSQQAVSRAVVREVRPDDVDELHSLLCGCFPDFLRDQRRWVAGWRWQYWDNPFRAGRPAGWVWTDGGRIVGHLGAVYVPLQVNGRPTTGAIGADYAVAQDAAAQGGIFVALELAQAFFTGIGECLAMATTANEKTGAIFTRFGAQPVPSTREFWRARATLGHLVRFCWGAQNHRLTRRALSGSVGRVAIPLIGACCRALVHRPAIPIPAGCSLETTVPQHAGDLGRLCEQAAANSTQPGPGEAIIWRADVANAYLDWRYLQHPERDNIRALVVRNTDGEVIGAAFVFLETNGTRSMAYVEDLVSLAGRTDVVRTLLCAALALACDHHVDYLVTMTGRRSIRHVYWELGFENRARSAPAAVIHASALGPDPSNAQIEFWHGVMF